MHKHTNYINMRIIFINLKFRKQSCKAHRRARKSSVENQTTKNVFEWKDTYTTSFWGLCENLKITHNQYSSVEASEPFGADQKEQKLSMCVCQTSRFSCDENFVAAKGPKRNSSASVRLTWMCHAQHSSYSADMIVVGGSRENLLESE